MPDLVQIDGSYGEGGGQIIRTSVSLAALTGRPLQISNVRAKRTKPGLQPQHLMAVQAAAALCGAKLHGAEVGSSWFSFEPQHPVRAGEYVFDIGTAGATPLVAQTVLVPLALADGPSRVSISGGTHVPHAPTAEYLEAVYIPALQRAGYNVAFNYQTAGFYPKGGGRIELDIQPSQPKGIMLEERGQLQDLQAYIVTSNLPEHVAERGETTVAAGMKAVGRKVKIERRDLPSLGPGAAVTLAASCAGGLAGFSSIGELRKPMEKVAETPGREFMKWWKSGAAVDEHLADQLVLPLALAEGRSRWKTPVVSEHLSTVITVVYEFIGNWLPTSITQVDYEDSTHGIDLTGTTLATILGKS